ncbi:3253_t:CDS:2 [Cetraspora pellucida]|uniref:3253_t:CDS:1 n=1 Tax=Cetraspora pellucida TaxID=1433469 RepID=A0A9N8Z7S7_9GLOM|nr:3253_t:CDS:2 [Cetraspora pellucida]
MEDIEMEDVEETKDMEDPEGVEGIECIKSIKGVKGVEYVEGIEGVEDIEDIVNTGSVENEITSTSKIPIKILPRAKNRCDQKYGPTTSTGNLNNHLKNKHNITLSLKKNRLQLTERPYGKGDIERKKECFDSIFNLIIGDQLPFSFIEHPLVIKMLNIYDPRYVLLSRKYLTKVTISSKLILDVATQWNSTYRMLCRFKEMQDELTLLKTAYQELESSYPNKEEWKSIDIMIYLLEPMLDANEMLSKSSYPTISDIRLTFMGIMQRINHFTTDKSCSKEECTMASSINNTLKKYWAIHDCDESAKIATILDPTSKLITFPLLNERDIAIASLRNVIAQYESPVLATNAASTSSFYDKRKKFISLISQQQTIELPRIGLPVSKELKTYLSLPIVESDSLQWWADNKCRFPVLAKIAQDYLAIQGTCVPCEEAFSTASITISKLRNHLNPETAHASLCLKS